MFVNIACFSSVLTFKGFTFSLAQGTHWLTPSPSRAKRMSANIFYFLSILKFKCFTFWLDQDTHCWRIILADEHFSRRIFLAGKTTKSCKLHKKIEISRLALTKFWSSDEHFSRQIILVDEHLVDIVLTDKECICFLILLLTISFPLSLVRTWLSLGKRHVIVLDEGAYTLKKNIDLYPFYIYACEYDGENLGAGGERRDSGERFFF